MTAEVSTGACAGRQRQVLWLAFCAMSVRAARATQGFQQGRGIVRFVFSKDQPARISDSRERKGGGKTTAIVQAA